MVLVYSGRLLVALVATTPRQHKQRPERRRVALALIGRPEVAFLDEPTSGIDVAGRQMIRELIVELRQSGVTVLVTTHDLALTELPSTLGAAAVNMHFEDRLENGRMTFDYRMRPGVVEHSNALALMRAIGLDV